MPNTREKLIELVTAYFGVDPSYYGIEAQHFADQLIANGVTIPVRCKDCKHLNVLNRKDIYAHCPKTNTVFLPFELDTRKHFCSYGERKDNERKAD